MLRMFFQQDFAEWMVYEVAQQAVKSTVWIKSKTALLTQIQARIKSSSTSKMICGEIKTLKASL